MHKRPSPRRLRTLAKVEKGDLHKPGDVLQMQLFRFTDSKYAEKGQVGFLMWARSGGNLLDTAAVKHYANSAT